MLCWKLLWLLVWLPKLKLKSIIILPRTARSGGSFVSLQESHIVVLGVWIVGAGVPLVEHLKSV